MYQTLLVFGAAFLGSAVESTEALTIVLAVGLTRGWRAPLLGTVAALVALAVLVIFFGQLIVTRIPDSALKLWVARFCSPSGFACCTKPSSAPPESSESTTEARPIRTPSTKLRA